MVLETVNPATGELLKEYDEDTTSDVEKKLETANEAFQEWRKLDIGERQVVVKQAGEILRENVDDYARLITEEMGKPITEAIAEVNKCVWVCDYYAEQGAEHLQSERIGTEPEAKTYVTHEPLGPVLAVMPWNYPYWQVFRFAAPALVAGNVGVFKHASNVPGCALEIEAIFREAGAPEGVFTSLLVGSDRVQDLIEDDRIRAVTLTGSEGAGRAVGETAGRSLKKSVLELGGSDPFIVLDDADIDKVAEKATEARSQNSGQSCIAAKRFLVHEDVYEEFIDAFVQETESLDVGAPLQPETDVGPQARAGLLEELHEQVEASIEAGADVVIGGEPLPREGNFYPPTILTDVPADCPAAYEELFGPVSAVFEVSDEAEAIASANDSRFGLSATVWTEDRERGERIANELEAGMTFVNAVAKSDPRLPFGGIKDSGYGRELAADGIKEFVNRKTVWIE
ncbi:NAD-dependent succinate-semialdehyde dehydrogenase [Halobellus rufus]|uniref:NAD-dependent succinate-semialdehyde dehydrogenase n=1 Tax=Halobellus rufus TaxID=1448860 RepID=UPI00067887AE|nr:NAD-dependent succinate-semialdehyde dehydrogenase [Halobellus rufus]